jgi:hypothetical protein
MGIQIMLGTSALDRVQALGMSWVKVQVAWSAMQPSTSEDITDDFRLLSQFVQEADSRGINVLLSVAKAPDWARSTPTGNDGPPDDPDAFANFLTLLLEEMGGSVSAIEVWNEPNLIREWDGVLAFNGGGYMTLFEPAYQAIRAYSPDIVIVTAGLAPTDGGTGAGVNDRAFLNQMYGAGLGNYPDIAIGVHPFGWGNAPDLRCCDPFVEQGWDDAVQFFFINTLEDYHSITNTNSHAVDLWLTEFGWATWEDIGGQPPEEWISYNTLEEQQIYAVRAFQIGQAQDYVGTMFLWNLNFATESAIAAQDEMAGYSLVLRDSTERPLFQTLVP